MGGVQGLLLCIVGSIESLMTSEVVGAYPVLNFIPVAALAGIMLVVVIHTFKWFSLAMLPNLLPQCARNRLGLNSKIPRVEVGVILLVTIMSIFANIAYAVGAGVAVCAIAFAWNSGENLEVTVTKEEWKK